MIVAVVVAVVVAVCCVLFGDNSITAVAVAVVGVVGY